MAGKRFNLNASRSSKQGTLINVGKESEEYKALTNTMTMHAEDMAELGLAEGQMAVVRSEFGQAEFKCTAGKVPAGKVSGELIHMTDLMPTFVAAAGGTVDPAWKVDGVNMLEVFQGKAAAPERTLFWEWTSEGANMHAAMRGDFKLLEINGAQFLYNVAEDPGERRTLAAEQPEIFQQLRQQLQYWRATEVYR